MRVTQQMLYQNFLVRMNSNLANLMESNLQASSQKRINRPSDDPVGTARLLDIRTSLAGMEGFKKNIDTAKGWLNLADETLLQASTIITRTKEISEQAATGTLTKDNRLQISYEARQLFKQMVALANTTYDNKSIFAGHKIDGNAFEERLWATANDGALRNASFSIEGSAEKTILVQFVDTANPEGGATTDLASAPATLGYRYSMDGGDTFTTVNGPLNVSGGRAVLDFQGVRMNLDATATVTTTALDNVGDSNGTWLWVRPTAEYLGDDKDFSRVDGFGVVDVAGMAEGSFAKNVAVRIDSAGTNLGEPITYSYSLDGGNNWVTGNVTVSGASPDQARLIVPGGVLTLNSNGGNILAAGNQFVIRPNMADISLRISASEEIAVNSVGKDIFGGVYKDMYSSEARLVFGDDPGKNLLDTMGRLVGYLETNNQQGIQEVLADLTKSQNQLLNKTANVAGRENRLQVAETILTGLYLNQSERLSAVEDVDVAELMTRLAQQQISYEAVLKTSSLIMRMTLVNYL